MKTVHLFLILLLWPSVANALSDDRLFEPEETVASGDLVRMDAAAFTKLLENGRTIRFVNMKVPEIFLDDSAYVTTEFRADNTYVSMVSGNCQSGIWAFEDDYFVFSVDSSNEADGLKMFFWQVLPTTSGGETLVFMHLTEASFAELQKSKPMTIGQLESPLDLTQQVIEQSNDPLACETETAKPLAP